MLFHWSEPIEFNLISNQMIKVFYDGKCGLCAREIAYYKVRDKDAAIEWVDVSSSHATLDALDISVATALKHMHAQLEDGRLVRGVDAFIQIWQRIPGWQKLASVASFKPMKVILDFFYEVFAYIRFKCYRHCRITEQA